MQFATHSELVGSHAFLSPSQYHWIRYDEEKLIEKFFTQMDAQKGSRLHEIAKELIEMKIKLPANGLTLSRYVNDAIGFKMTPEQVLVYSDICFGTADAISYDPRKKILRVHDLKNGVTPAKMDQLMVYCALFVLEYGLLLNVKPHEVTYLLRIYQNDDVFEYQPELDEIVHIIDRIVTFDRIIQKLKVEAFS